MRTNSRTEGFTLIELIIATTLSLLTLAAVCSSFIMFVRSTVRLSNYDKLETNATRALELFARDIRMAQSINTHVPTGPATERNIQHITLDVLNTTGSGSTSVDYEFTGSNTFTRKFGSASTQTLVTDIVSGTGRFYAYNLNQALAQNDYETSQIKISMTASPTSNGNYAKTSKRIISARFVLRN